MIYKIKKRNQKGFTLIEIIVVLIILGILAAFALPNLFMWIERSHAAEIQVNFGSIARSIQACLMKNGNVPNPANLCDSYAEVGITDPSTANYSYSLSSISSTAGPGFTYDHVLITLTRNNFIGDPGGRFDYGTGSYYSFIWDAHSRMGTVVGINDITPQGSSGLYKGV